MARPGPRTGCPRENKPLEREAPGHNTPHQPARALLAARPLPMARWPASCLAPGRPGLGPAQSGRARKPLPRERHRGRARASRELGRPGRGLETRCEPPPSAQPPAPGLAAASAAAAAAADALSQDTLHARDPRPRVNFIRLREIRPGGCSVRRSILRVLHVNLRQSLRRRGSWQPIGSRHCTPAPPSPR